MEETTSLKSREPDFSNPDQRREAENSSPHARQAFLPAPHANRHGVALCLSGGGFRAALFHLGALRRLNELGILTQVDKLSSVSGGSILAAHLANTLPSCSWQETPIRDWDTRVAGPFQAFTSRNLRTRPLLKWLALPWNWATTSMPIEEVAHRFERKLTSLRLIDLPERPEYLLCATDMTSGSNWVFGKAQMGDYRVQLRQPSVDWSLGRSAAASACFPPVFDAMRLAVGEEQITYGKHARTLRRQGRGARLMRV